MNRLPVIGFDAKRAVANFTGLGNYSRLVIDSLAHALPDSRLLLYAPKPHGNSRLDPTLALPNVELRGPAGLWRQASGLWRLTRGLTAEARRDGVSLFHGLSNELPLDLPHGGIPSVVTIHDLIFRHFPRGYKRADRLIYDYKFRHAARESTRIIAVSEATRRDIIASYDIDPGKIDVVYQGCDSRFAREVTDEELARVKDLYALPDTFIAVVGTIEPRKNQMLTLQALRALPHDVRAVVIGRPTPYLHELHAYVRRHGLTGRVRFIHDASFADLPAIYRLATLSAYTSRMEGFGIPVIESISAGTPVVACTGTCLEEAGGPGALYVNPDDPEEMAQAVCRLLSDGALRASMAEAGRDYVRRFSPEAFTSAILATYEKALETAH